MGDVHLEDRFGWKDDIVVNLRERSYDGGRWIELTVAGFGIVDVQVLLLKC